MELATLDSHTVVIACVSKSTDDHTYILSRVGNIYSRFSLFFQLQFVERPIIHTARQQADSHFLKIKSHMKPTLSIR